MTGTIRDVEMTQDRQVKAIAYHELTGSLVAHTNVVSGMPNGRLLFRSVVTPQYQPVGEFGDGVSIDSFIIDQCRPYLYFITFRCREWNGVIAGDWDSLYRFDLERHQCEHLTQRGSLRIPNDYQRVWLAGLLSVCLDGKAIYCRAGLQAPNGGVNYYVAKMHLATLAVEPIVGLEAVLA